MSEPSKEIRQLMMDYRYSLIEEDDDSAVYILDQWLEGWLSRKNHCPVCGESYDDETKI